ncbi:MAG: RnfH family protein [Gammaproteobacteria bacterium]
MAETESISVQIAYARADTGTFVTVRIPQGASIAEAIERSGLLGRFPEIDLGISRVGVFGQLTELTNPARAGDRIEIYRPLLADPKEMRRRRTRSL